MNVKMSVGSMGTTIVVGMLSAACSQSGGADIDDATGTRAFTFLSQAASQGDHPISPKDRESLRSAASRLCDLQADRIADNARNGYIDTDPDDGGWDFTLAIDQTSHSQNASPTNLYGATALGLWAVDRGGLHRPRFYTAMLDTYLGMEARSEVDSPPDFVYLVLLADRSGDAGFSTLARQRYDARVSAAGGAQALGESIREQRHAQGYDGLIAYDLAWLTLGAAALNGAFPSTGYENDARTYATIVNDDLSSSTPCFDINDPHEAYYTQGLAWSLVTLSWTAAAPATLQTVRALLMAAQGADGSWGWNADYPDPNLQATAHAVQALTLALPNRLQAAAAAYRGATWLISQQRATGGWEPDPGLEYPIIDGEIAVALFLSRSLHGDGRDLIPHASSTQGTSQALTAGDAQQSSPTPGHRAPPPSAPLDL